MFISCEFDIFQVCREYDVNVSQDWWITAYLAHAGAVVDNEGSNFIIHGESGKTFQLLLDQLTVCSSG